MIIHEETVMLETPTGPMLTRIFKPRCATAAGGGEAAAAELKFGGVIVHSEIYQITGPLERLCRVIASEGFVVAIGECYHEMEKPGCALAYDQAGTDAGNAHKVAKPVSAYDTDHQAIVKHLVERPDCNGRLGTVGMCLGGHLALRCAFEPEVLAGICLFATDVHQGSLGAGGDDTLGRIAAGSLAAPTEMTMIFGKQDNHVPPAGRATIKTAMEDADVDFQWLELNAQHAFVRDELSKGRYDPGLTAVCYQLMFETFQRRLTYGAPSSALVTPQKSSAGPANC
eukprot:gene2051-29558_t